MNQNRTPADSRATAHHTIWRADLGHRYDSIFFFGRYGQLIASWNWIPPGFRRVVKKPPFEAPNLKPRAIALAGFIIWCDRTVRPLRQHIGCPVEIIVKAFVEQMRRVVADERVHRSCIHS